MQGFIKGMAVGVAVATAALMGYAYGTEDGRADASADLEAACRVEVGYGSPSFGEQCRFDQVMVGIRGDYLLCADVSVECPN